MILGSSFRMESRIHSIRRRSFIRRTLRTRPITRIFGIGGEQLEERSPHSNSAVRALRGKVNLSRLFYKGQCLLIRILEGREIIEQRVLAQNAIQQSLVETFEPSRICLIERKAYLVLIQRNSTLGLKRIELLSSEVRPN